MKRQDPFKKQLDDIRVLIEEAKIRNNFSDYELATYLGISDRTLRDKKNGSIDSAPEQIIYSVGTYWEKNQICR